MDYSTATGTWKLDPTHTTLGFSARHAMVTKVRGRFSEFEGDINIDGNDPSATRINVNITAASVTTDSDDRDAHLRSGDFLDTEKYPNLTFTSTNIVEKGDGKFALTGNLTIKDVTHPITLDVEYVGVSPDPWGGTRIGFEASTELSRKDYGLTFNVPLDGGGVLVSDKVRLELDVEAVKQ